MRCRHGWPLEPSDDMTHWYTSGAEGYTDYPAYDPDQAASASETESLIQ